MLTIYNKRFTSSIISDEIHPPAPSADGGIPLRVDEANRILGALRVRGSGVERELLDSSVKVIQIHGGGSDEGTLDAQTSFCAKLEVLQAASRQAVFTVTAVAAGPPAEPTSYPGGSIRERPYYTMGASAFLSETPTKSLADCLRLPCRALPTRDHAPLRLLCTAQLLQGDRME